jgi:hypothetical protein
MPSRRRKRAAGSGLALDARSPSRRLADIASLLE